LGDAVEPRHGNNLTSVILPNYHRTYKSSVAVSLVIVIADDNAINHNYHIHKYLFGTTKLAVRETLRAKCNIVDKINIFDA